MRTKQGQVVCTGRNERLSVSSDFRELFRLIGSSVVTRSTIRSRAGSVPTYARASRKKVLTRIRILSWDDKAVIMGTAEVCLLFLRFLLGFF